jgi:hypothetical protein
MSINNSLSSNSAQLPIQQMEELESLFDSTENLHHFLTQIEGEKEIQQVLSKVNLPCPQFPIDTKKSRNLMRVFLITTSKNTYNQEGELIREHAPIPEKQIKDKKVWNKTFCVLENEVVFIHGGLCRGMCQWFHFLYLNTQGHFSDRRKHMIAICEQFANGAGKAAALLQSLDAKKGKILNLNIGAQQPHSKRNRPDQMLKILCADWTNDSLLKDIVDKLNDLPVGSYTITIPRHALAMVKINNRLSYFFDPDEGVQEIQGTRPGQELSKLISACDDLDNGGNIRIIPVTLRDSSYKKHKISDISPEEQTPKKRKLEATSSLHSRRIFKKAIVDNLEKTCKLENPRTNIT